MTVNRMYKKFSEKGRVRVTDDGTILGNQQTQPRSGKRLRKYKTELKVCDSYMIVGKYCLNLQIIVANQGLS